MRADTLTPTPPLSPKERADHGLHNIAQVLARHIVGHQQPRKGDEKAVPDGVALAKARCCKIVQVIRS